MYHPDTYTMPDFDHTLISAQTYKSLKTSLTDYKLGGGYSRIAYGLSDMVIVKLPMHVESSGYYGILPNVQEYIKWLEFKFGYSEIPVAPCELVFTADNIPVIVMARVNTNYARNCPKGSPSWTEELFDGQVGTLPNGMWVCYDAGSGLGENVFFDDDSRSKVEDVFYHAVIDMLNLSVSCIA